MLNVKRADLIEQLFNKGYTKKAAADIVDEFVKIILENLTNGNTVSIYGFGSFEILERKTRSCPNPKTGEQITIPAHLIPRFSPGSRMRVAVKKAEDAIKRGDLIACG